MDTTPIVLLEILAVVAIVACVITLRRDHIKRIREEREANR